MRYIKCIGFFDKEDNEVKAPSKHFTKDKVYKQAKNVIINDFGFSQFVNTLLKVKLGQGKDVVYVKFKKVKSPK